MKPLLVLFGATLLHSARGADSQVSFYEPVRPARAIQIVAHRGLHVMTPTNSLAAITECQVDYIEWASVDVRRTKDGHHVVIAEESISTETDQLPRRTSELTLAELQQIDIGIAFAPRYAGMHPASLSEVFSAAKGRVNLLLNCSQVSPAELVREIEAAGMQRQVLLAGDIDVLADIQTNAATDLPTLVPFDPASSIDDLIREREPTVVELKPSDVTADLVRSLQASDFKVLVKVLGGENDNAATWSKMFDAGVNFIVTDNPAEVRFAEVRRRIPEFPVQIACHRGANRYAPENTLPAIELAAALHADYIEIDVRTTSDDKLFLLHDRSLDRTTSGHGPINEQPSTAITKLDAGSWFGAPFARLRVPTFDEGLAAFGPHTHAYLDAKDITPEALLAAIRKHGLIDRHVVCQSVDYGRRLKALDPAVHLLPPLKSPHDLDSVAELHPYGVDARWEILSKELINRCHAAGIKVFSDALGPHETIEDYRQAIASGIDVIQTDYPLRVLRAIELEAHEGEETNRS